ncbi:unnamed protein product [Allacma fusca]|uniref:Uncharacterized protein n=1 Tax=Allacma fusca TaxID=39272 RepID=A0A8J2P8U3_9HEXA|nr:unnamed protein product [Allacma fusca]
MGVCFRHHYNGSIQSSGINFGLQLKIDWSRFLLGESQGRDQGLKIFLHPGKDEALTEIDGIQITPGEDISIAIRLKEFQSLNRSANPCMYASAYSKSHCVNRCFQGFLAEVFGKCYLPFMGTFLEENENFTRCETPESYNQAMMEFNRQRFNGTLWAGCERRCLIECNKIVYTPFVESVAPSLKKISKLVFYFPEMSYEIVQEKEAYDLIALLCDVGGTFGLFLGCSILTLVELLEFIVIFIFKKNA